VRELEVTPDGSGPPPRLDGEQLARLAAARDEGAWALIFERHFHAIFAFVRSRIGSPEAAEDIASQVFEIAFSRAASFDYRGVPIEAWLFGIARNLVRDQVKKAIRRGPEEGVTDANAPGEPDLAPAADLHQDLVSAMTALTEDQQTVLTLRFLMDRSVEETAALMERSEDAVKTLQRRALAAMHRVLAGSGYGVA
jgi:RNA polymerase sigma-70 factor (ECF subfamily)